MRVHFRRLLLAAGMFSLVWGARLALIDRFGSDLPVKDQWDGEAEAVLRPYFAGSLSPSDLLSPHNEHRIACTKALALALVLTNGQWDARLECVVDAALQAGLALAVLLFGWPLLAPRWRVAWFLTVALLFGAPISWSNLVSGFASQQVLLNAFSLGACALLTTARANTLRWWTGLGLACLALITMASGLLAAVAVSVALLTSADPRQSWRRHRPTLLACAGVTLAGVALQAPVHQLTALHAHSVGEWTAAFWRMLQWPVRFFPPYALLAWAPFAWIAGRCLRDRSRTEVPDSERALFAAGLWVLAQFAATAYARGAGAPWPASRYLDVIVAGMAVNVLALFLALEHTERPGRPRRMVWIAVVAGALLLGTGLSFRLGATLVGSLPEHRTLVRQWENSVRAYLATGNRTILEANPIPHPSPQVLATRLASPEIRALLPPSVRPVEQGPLGQIARALTARGEWLFAFGLLLAVPGAIPGGGRGLRSRPLSTTGAGSKRPRGLQASHPPASRERARVEAMPRSPRSER